MTSPILAMMVAPFGHEESSWSEDDGTDTYIVCNYSDKCPTLLDDGLVWHDYMKVSPKEDKPYMVKFKNEEYPQYCLYKEGGFGDYDGIVSMWAEIK